MIFVSYCATGAYTGTDCLTRRIEALIESLTIPNKVEALVHFGNPLAATKINDIPLKMGKFLVSDRQSQINVVVKAGGDSLKLMSIQVAND